jgi:hypothetical protein
MSIKIQRKRRKSYEMYCPASSTLGRKGVKEANESGFNMVGTQTLCNNELRLHSRRQPLPSKTPHSTGFAFIFSHIWQSCEVLHMFLHGIELLSATVLKPFPLDNIGLKTA